MKVKGENNRNMLCYLEDALKSNNMNAIKYIIGICLYNDKFDLLNFIRKSKILESTKDFANNFIENEINETILSIHEVDKIVIWIVDNFPEKEYDVYKVLLEYGYDESVDWIIRRIDGYESEIFKTLNLAIDTLAPSDVIKKLWKLYKHYIECFK